MVPALVARVPARARGLVTIDPLDPLDAFLAATRRTPGDQVPGVARGVAARVRRGVRLGGTEGGVAALRQIVAADLDPSEGVIRRRVDAWAGAVGEAPPEVLGQLVLVTATSALGLAAEALARELGDLGALDTVETVILERRGRGGRLVCPYWRALLATQRRALAPHEGLAAELAHATAPPPGASAARRLAHEGLAGAAWELLADPPAVAVPLRRAVGRLTREARVATARRRGLPRVEWNRLSDLDHHGAEWLARRTAPADPAAQVAQADELHRLRAELHQLPADMRQALEVDMTGATVAQVAARTGAHRNTIANRREAAKALLNQRLRGREKISESVVHGAPLTS